MAVKIKYEIQDDEIDSYYLLHYVHCCCGGVYQNNYYSFDRHKRSPQHVKYEKRYYPKPLMACTYV